MDVSRPGEKIIRAPSLRLAISAISLDPSESFGRNSWYASSSKSNNIAIRCIFIGPSPAIPDYPQTHLPSPPYQTQSPPSATPEDCPHAPAATAACPSHRKLGEPVPRRPLDYTQATPGPCASDYPMYQLKFLTYVND